MRYSSTHKEEVRQRLLASSRGIAKRGGFESTGVDALMSAVGLTGGAFYSHFDSKQTLFQAIIDEEVKHSTEMLAGDENSPADHVTKRIRGYLSTFHALHPETGCMLPTLAAELARAEPKVREAVERGLKQLQKSWSERVGDPDDAWALIAQCVGALVLARAVESDKTRKEILGSSRRSLDKKYGLETTKGRNGS